ncbi:MAG: YceD family protein [Candidatus Obscuribacterales bacterium]|nr:YceD family protein [Candidatus Obscuribacterales bacterium]
MKISVDELNSLAQKRLRLSFSQSLPVDGAVKPVVGDILLCASVGGVRLTGQVTTLLKLTCQTCLRPYFQNLAVEIEEQFSARPFRDGKNLKERERERELTRDDFYELLPEDGFLDIDDIVYQAVTLASPVYCRCGDQCPGPPKPLKASGSGDFLVGESQTCGDDDIDPRWKNLKSLFPKHEKEENS